MSLVDSKSFGIVPRRVEFGQMDLDMTGVAPVLAKALQAACDMNVPTMTIEQMEIIDQMPVSKDLVFNALKVLPLVLCKKTIDDYEYKENCTCRNPEQGCVKCAVEFHLTASSGTQHNVAITTAHLQCPSGELMSMDLYRLHVLAVAPQTLTVAQREVFAKLKPAVLFYLGAHQQINIRVWARKGVGQRSGLWIPASVAAYRKRVTITLSSSDLETMTLAERKTLVESCEYGVLEWTKAPRIPVQSGALPSGALQSGAPTIPVQSGALPSGALQSGVLQSGALQSGAIAPGKSAVGSKSTKFPKGQKENKSEGKEGMASGADWVGVVDRGRACIYCKKCCLAGEAMGRPDVIRVDQQTKPHAYHWLIESRNQPEPWFILVRACQALRSQFADMRQYLETHAPIYEEAQDKQHQILKRAQSNISQVD